MILTALLAIAALDNEVNPVLEQLQFASSPRLSCMLTLMHSPAKLHFLEFIVHEHKDILMACCMPGRGGGGGREEVEVHNPWPI